MKSFNVIIYDFNGKKFVPYDIMPYLMRECEENLEYLKEGNEPNTYHWNLETFEDYKKFIEKRAQYQWWSRCEYEIILQSWPKSNHEEKWDVYDQVLMNLDIIAETLMYNVNERVD